MDPFRGRRLLVTSIILLDAGHCLLPFSLSGGVTKPPHDPGFVAPVVVATWLFERRVKTRNPGAWDREEEGITRHCRKGKSVSCFFAFLVFLFFLEAVFLFFKNLSELLWQWEGFLSRRTTTYWDTVPVCTNVTANCSISNMN
jgi:hypothetical protein